MRRTPGRPPLTRDPFRELTRPPRPEDVREYWLVTERNTVVHRLHEGWG